jgi:polyisoprenoid-binding protein YceI
MSLRLCVLSVLCLPFAATHAESRHYELDPVHTRIAFFVQHAGFSRAIGTFAGITGELDFDPDQPQQARVDATVPIASLELGDAKWRERILDPTFFGVKNFPDARFVSTSVETAGDGRLTIHGDLTLHGVTQRIALDARLNQIKRHPLTLRNTAGFSARTTLSRFAFGMEKWKKLVGDEVEVLIEVEATRRRDDGEVE